MADEKISALTSAGALAGTEPLPIVQGGVTKKTTVQDVANLKATPNLQQVTTAGGITTNNIGVDNGTDSVYIKPLKIELSNSIGGVAGIISTSLTAATDFELPNKATGPQTFAMLSDIIAGSGDVVGPASAVSNNVVFFDGTTGKLIKDSGLSLSGTNTGNETTSTLGATINGAAAATPNDTDLVATVESSVVKKITWTNVKTFLSTYFNGIYQAILTAANMHTFVDSLNTMTTPADADRMLIVDNSASLAKKITWANIKATLKTYFDTLYAPIAQKDTILVSIMGTIIASPLDSTSYHLGIQPWTPSTTPAFRAFKFTDAGTIEKFSFALSQTINGSNQTVTIYLRNVTTSTDNLIGTFTSDFGASTTLKTLFTGLSISVNTTDDWTLKILTPAWGTNPSDWVFGGTLSLTKS